MKALPLYNPCPWAAQSGIGKHWSFSLCWQAECHRIRTQPSGHLAASVLLMTLTAESSPLANAHRWTSNWVGMWSDQGEPTDERQGETCVQRC